MSWLKSLERFAKRVLVLVLAGVLRRRVGTLDPTRVRRVLLVRIDARMGEALLTTPLLEALRARGIRADVLVHPKISRVLDGHPAAERVLSFDRRRLWLGPLAPGIRAIRAVPYDLIVDCGNWTEPSVTSAVVARLIAGATPLAGPAVWPTRLLHSLRIPPSTDTRSEWRQRLHLLSPLGAPLEGQLSFRPPREEPAVRDFLGHLEIRRTAVVNPGGRLGWRRIPPALFAAAARVLVARGLTPIISWGPGEEALAREVLSLSPGAVLSPPTGIDGLAMLMQASELTVCNNTGPMHLSVAVGTPTFALFLRMDVERWGHPQPPHRMVELTGEIETGTGEIETGTAEQRVQLELESFVSGIARH